MISPEIVLIYDYDYGHIKIQLKIYSNRSGIDVNFKDSPLIF